MPDGAQALERLADSIAEHACADRSQDGDLSFAGIGVPRKDQGELHAMTCVDILQLGTGVHGDDIRRHGVGRDDLRALQFGFEGARFVWMRMRRVAEGNDIAELGVIGGGNGDVAFLHRFDFLGRESSLGKVGGRLDLPEKGTRPGGAVR